MKYLQWTLVTNSCNELVFSFLIQTQTYQSLKIQIKEKHCDNLKSSLMKQKTENSNTVKKTSKIYNKNENEN